MNEPVEVVFAIHLALFIEKLFVQKLPTQLTPDAGSVPRFVQHLEQKPVPDRPEASGALVSGHCLVHF